MVDGKLTCIGSAQRLKDRYGMGYLVKVKLAFIQPEHEAMEGAANGDEAAVARVSMVVEGEKMFVQYFNLHTKQSYTSRKSQIAFPSSPHS